MANVHLRVPGSSKTVPFCLLSYPVCVWSSLFAKTSIAFEFGLVMGCWWLLPRNLLQNPQNLCFICLRAFLCVLDVLAGWFLHRLKLCFKLITKLRLVLLQLFGVYVGIIFCLGFLISHHQLVWCICWVGRQDLAVVVLRFPWVFVKASPTPQAGRCWNWPFG